MAGLMKIGKAVPENLVGQGGISKEAGQMSLRDLFSRDGAKDPGGLPSTDAPSPLAPGAPQDGTAPAPPTTPADEGNPPEQAPPPGQPPVPGFDPGMGGGGPPAPPMPNSATPMGPGTFLRPGQGGRGASAARAPFRSPMFGAGGPQAMRFGPGSPLAATGDVSMTFGDPAAGGGASIEDILAMLAQSGGGVA